MKYILLLLLLLSNTVNSNMIKCMNPKKLWGMTNEINDVTVSNIGIYMCFEDPLNLYNLPNTESTPKNVILSDKNLNYKSYNDHVFKIFYK